MLGSFGSQLTSLFTQFTQLFGGIGGGKAILEIFGQVLAVSVVLPPKLVITQVQLTVDALTGLWDAGKRVANFFGADFELDPNGSFDALTKHLNANAESIGDTLLGQDKQLADSQTKSIEDSAKARVEAAKKKVEETVAEQLEALKAREANIKAALALVAAGSAEELRLKKLEVVTKRDIDLLGEKQTAGDKKVIRAEALRDLRQLQDEYDKKNSEAAAKRAKEQADEEKKIADLKAGLLTDELQKKIRQLTAAAEQEKATAKGTAEQIAEQRKLIDQKLAVDIAAEQKKRADKEADEALDAEKRKNALLVDEWERRRAELETAAAAETRKVLDTDSQAAEKRRLIQDKLQRDLAGLEEARATRQQEIDERIAAVDEDIALRRIARRQQANEWSQERAQADAAEQTVRQAKLEEEEKQRLDKLRQEFEAGTLTKEQYLAEQLSADRQYLQDKDELEEEFAQRSRERDKAGTEFGLEQTSAAIQTVADFQKIASDKEMAKLDKDKKTRLAKVEVEYKAGKLSKEQYEAAKSGIEADYGAKTRAIKRDAAIKEKESNVAEAIIQTALSVIKASPNIPFMVAAGITDAASVAKIIATPIPEFEKGGFFGRAARSVKQYATGGRINARAGVAEAGQRHSGGGIRMVDGATGEHLGEWERGEAYMILSRDTYANNKHLVDELIDTSLYRGGAPVRQRPGYYEDGGTFSSTSAAPSPTATNAAG